MKEKVYAYIATIPEGRVTTYGRIAAGLGNKNLARVVGNILPAGSYESDYEQ